ncbi:kinase-like domain-containing protein [Morchella snyderi]|nr:kinase-like domain-containing protein [Morchella snyderi]
MAQHFERFGQQRLTTEFLDGSPFIYRHTYSNHGTPLRVENWARTETLGSGTYGTVYKEACAETKGVRAVKRIDRTLAKSNELDILAKLRAYPEHFVRFLGWFNDSEYIYLAMEYLPGDLDELMKERDLSEDETKMVTKQILAGLEIMHGKDICHRDLKPGNILVARRIPLTIKIADFGVSKSLVGTQARTTTGTTAFMA